MFMGDCMKEVFVKIAVSEHACSPLPLSDFYFLPCVSAAVHVTPPLSLPLGVKDFGAPQNQAVMEFRQAGLIAAFLLTLLSAGELMLNYNPDVLY